MWRNPNQTGFSNLDSPIFRFAPPPAATSPRVAETDQLLTHADYFIFDRCPRRWLVVDTFSSAHCLYIHNVYEHGGDRTALDAEPEAISIELGPRCLQWISSSFVQLHVLRIPRQCLFIRIQLNLPTRRLFNESPLTQGNVNNHHHFNPS